MREVIRIDVLAVDGGEMQFRDRVSKARSSARLCGHLLSAGDDAVVEVGRVKGRLQVLRVLSPERAPARLHGTGSRQDERHGVLVGGAPLVFRPDPAGDDTVAMGQVRTAEFGFSARTTAERDAGLTAKRRPCVVVEVDGDYAAVCPIHGTNSAVRRSGRGRRLLGWRAVGLRKPSVVSAEARWVPLAEMGPLIGVLGAEDRARLVRS